MTRVCFYGTSDAEYVFLTLTLALTTLFLRLLRSLDNPNPVARLQLPAEIQHPYVAYDSSGLVFGVMGKDTLRREQSLKLFDSRNYDKGPFQEIAPTREIISSSISPAQTQRLMDSVWTDFKFSPDGSKVLINTNSEFCIIADGESDCVYPCLYLGVPSSPFCSFLLLLLYLYML